MNLKQDFIPQGRGNRPGYKMTPAYITIHDTGNPDAGADALSHAKYLKGDAAAAAPVSWHFTVDGNIIVQHLPLDESGWHATDGREGPGNRTSIGVEIAENSDGDRIKAEENAALLVAWLLQQLKLPIVKVVQHNHWYSKNCPRVLRARPGGWENFLKEVEKHMGDNKNSKPAFTAEIIDAQGKVHLVPADAIKLENGTTWIKSRTFTELASGIVNYDAAKNKSTFDFSARKPPPASKIPVLERLTKCDVITARPEQLKVSLIKGKLNKDGINGGYFDGSLNPLGIVIIDGKEVADRVSHRPPRSCFVLWYDYDNQVARADIFPGVTAAKDLTAQHAVSFALGAGPNLFPQPEKGEGFQDDVFSSSRPRSAVGITAAGLVKMVATDAMTLQQLSDLMRELGCVQAMNLDGGGSSQMRYGGKLIRDGDGRKLSTAILLS